MTRRDDVALLRRVAEGLETGEDRQALADRLRRYLAAAADGCRLDDVMGVAPLHGERPWWVAEAIEARDAALRAMAARFHAELPLVRQAAVIRAQLATYAAGQWRFDRRGQNLPAAYVGTPREHLFDALRAHDSVPSVRQIRRILRP